MEAAVQFFKDEWSVLSGAPLTFIMGWLLFAGLSFAFLWKFLLSHKDATIQTLKERVSWTEEQRDSYKGKLGEFEGSTESIKDSSPEELKGKALELVGEIRAFLARALFATDSLVAHHAVEPRSENEEDRKGNWLRFTKELLRRSSEASLGYDRDYKVKAIVMRDRLLAELPTYSVSEDKRDEYEHPVNPIVMGKVADDLEKMARLL